MGTVSAKVSQVRIDQGFWSEIIRDMREKVIPYQWDALNDRVEGAEPSHCIRNFEIAAGLRTGEFHGFVFQDSDLAKWLEAVAYALMTKSDPALEKTADEAIALIGKAQGADGYLNTYFTIKAPDKRYQNLRDWHELYCAGHMMEAAVAYYEATGKRELLDIMLKMAGNIMAVIGPEEGKLRGYPGHEEIELALVKMYRVTGDEKLLKLSKYFIDERGQEPNYFEKEHHLDGTTNPQYHQAHLPVREQKTLEGHSVRALYLLSGMADVAAQTGDESLLNACETLFENVRQKRMYVTGGVGSTHHGEAFSFDYDLPNDTVYAETCASIALVFFCRRMLNIRPDSKYADVMERALYNTCIAGKSLDGRTFFYVNPLEVQPEAGRKDPGKRHVLPVRPKWFGCACCPPNLARLVMSLGQYLYATDGRSIYAHLYADSEAELSVGEQSIKLVQKTAYPYDGQIGFTLSKGQYALNLRLPEWCKKYILSVNGTAYDAPVKSGYLVIDRAFEDGDTVSLKLEMPARRVYANPRVIDDIGKVAFARGPLVYCAEEAGNGAHLQNIFVPRNAAIQEGEPMESLLGVIPLTLPAFRQKMDAHALYLDAPVPVDEPTTLTLIPYYAWANRGENEMSVWLREC